MSVVVQASNVSYLYPGDTQKVLESITFAVPEGSRVVVLGENGAGKSTLLQLINGNHKSPTGSLTVANQDAFEETRLRQKVKYLSSSLPGYLLHLKALYKVKDIVRRYSTFHENASSLLSLFDLHDDMRIEELSNGQLRKLQIVMHVLHPFDLLLVDECTRDVDVVGRKAFLDVLLRSTRGTLFDGLSKSTIMYATHILDDMHEWATHVLHVHNGNAILHHIKTIPCLYTYMQKVSGVSKTDIRCVVDTFSQEEPFFKMESSIMSKGFAQDKGNFELQVRHFDVKGFFSSLKSAGNSEFARQECTVTIPAGSRVVLFGPNGSGKSVLLQLLAGERFYSRKNHLGMELLVGERLCFHDTTLVSDIAGGCGQWWNDGEPEWNLTLKEMLACRNEHWFACKYTLYLIDLLAINVHWRVNKISTGERKRVQLLLRLVPLRRLILLDEATADLDVALRQKFLVFLQHLSIKRGITVIYCSHIYEDLMWWGNYALFLRPSKPFSEAITNKYKEFLTCEPSAPSLLPKRECIAGMESIFFGSCALAN